MKKIVLIILLCLACLSLYGCAGLQIVPGNNIENCKSTRNQVLLNSGSCFAYTFCDEETGVWYISTSEGVTPRLNADGSLYTE